MLHLPWLLGVGRLLLSYENDTSNKVIVEAIGNDGLDGFVEAVQKVTVREAPSTLCTPHAGPRAAVPYNCPA